MLLFNRNTIKGALLIIAALFFHQSASAQFVLSKELEGTVSVREHASLIDCGENNISFNEVISYRGERSPLKEIGDIGFTTHYYWVDLPITNSSNEAQTMFIETARPIIDHVDLYSVGDNGDTLIQRSGDAIPFKEKSVEHRKSLFKISIPANSSFHAYINIKSDGEALQVPLYLHSPDKMLSDTYKEQIFYGLFYGILLLAAIIYSFFYVGMRDLTFLYYGAYVVFIALMQFSIDGLSHQFITPAGGWFNDRIVLTTALIAGFFLGKYGETFLNVKNQNPILYKLFQFVYVGLGLSLLALLSIPQFLAYGYPIANGLGLLVLLLILTSVVLQKLKGIKVDLYFMAGVAFLVMGFVVFILNNFNSIPHSFFSENGPKFGTGLEVVFLSLSMSNRIKELRLKNEANQRLALQRAEDMNEIKSSFISNISHELRTPLNLIMGMTTSLKNSTNDTKLQEKYDHILDSSDSLLHLIEDILNFTEVEKGNQKLKMEEFKLEQLIKEITAEFKPRAMQKGLRFELIAEDLPESIRGDRHKLKQILEHLLDNAIKFTESGFVSFGIRSTVKNKNAQLNFEIHDSGSGISQDKMSTIYESFTKKSFRDKREFGGLGLGLYLAKTFVDLQGGDISLKNNQAGGVSCKIKLDYEITESKTIPTSSNQKGTETENEHCNILYVEDNEMNQMVLQMMIAQRPNSSITIANHGEEGLQKLKEQKFDIVLMDLQMPVMDGFETTEAIRRGDAGLTNLNIPIIAVTADITEATRKKVLDLGANDYTTKPVKADVLFEKIWRLLEYQKV